MLLKTVTNLSRGVPNNVRVPLFSLQTTYPRLGYSQTSTLCSCLQYKVEWSKIQNDLLAAVGHDLIPPVMHSHVSRCTLCNVFLAVTSVILSNHATAPYVMMSLTIMVT